MNFIPHFQTPVRRLQNTLDNFLTTETFASGFNDLCYGTIIEKNDFFIGSSFLLDSLDLAGPYTAPCQPFCFSQAFATV